MPENLRSRYAIVIERAGDNYSAHVPNLPGCIATGTTIADVKREITQAIRLYIDVLRADRQPFPEPTTPVQLRSAPRAEDPFVTFTEWASAADEAAYADL